MLIENDSRSAIISDLLGMTRDFAAGRGHTLKAETETDATKGELITALVSVGLGLATNALYDCLKIAAKRILSAKPSASGEVVKIDGEPRTLESLAKDD